MILHRTPIYCYKLRMMAAGSMYCVVCLKQLDHSPGSEDARHLCAEDKLKYRAVGFSETHPPPPGAHIFERNRRL